MTSPRRFTIEGRDLGYPTWFARRRIDDGCVRGPDARGDRLISESDRAGPVLPGRGVLSMNCVHYVDTDCGTYNEVDAGDPGRGPSGAGPDSAGFASRFPRLHTWRSLHRRHDQHALLAPRRLHHAVGG